MHQTPAPDTRGLQRHLADRVLTALQRRRIGGRRVRAMRRVAAVLLLVGAGVLATAGPSPGAGGGIRVLAAARDLPAGTTLSAGDVVTTAVAAVPDGVLHSGTSIVGRVLSGPVRRGEVLTDVRLLGDAGPAPGPGRAAVPIRPDDPGTVDLLAPGMHVAVIGVAADGVAHTLTDDAIVLWIPGSSGPSPPATSRLVVLAVPTRVADAVAALAITGSVTLRFA